MALSTLAMADFTAGQWALCVQGFNMYLQSFARTDMGDDAQYYIGDCYQNDGKFTGTAGRGRFLARTPSHF